MIALLRRQSRAAPAGARAIGRAAVRALLAELTLFPKPGLVSLVDNGSHPDMTALHFIRSAGALRGYFVSMAVAGAQDACFDDLRRLAVQAEVRMLRATGGANTHRGAIFSVGLLAAAAGRRRAGHGDRMLGDIVRTHWGADIHAHRRDPSSHGSEVTRRHGSGGAQAEAAAGFPSVYQVALPAYRAAVAATGDSRHAALQALFALVAAVEDTNLVHRGGIDGLRFAREAAHGFLDQGGVLAPHAQARALAVHRAFVERGLSPGGCADLLAACLFTISIGD